MKKTVHEVAKLTGISVRTLHYYDEIGLLLPSETTEAGYRLYDDTALERLQQILFFRELEFPLKNIAQIMGSPSFDQRKAMENHRNLLLLKRQRLDGLLHLVDDILKGEQEMSFKEFDRTEIENTQKKYAKEAEERWGGTDAYAESATKTKAYTKEDWARIQSEAQKIHEAFAASMEKAPRDPAVQKLVKDWQDHITQNYYTCTNEILAGLGEMYVADERFTKNINQYGKGLALFMSIAIQEYCKK
jgi:DNA-binding transcriptional MerR regulator